LAFVSIAALLSGCVSAPPSVSAKAESSATAGDSPATSSRSHPKTTSHPTTSVAVSTTQAALDPVALATTVGLVQTDVPGDATQVSGPGQLEHSSDECRVASGSPFKANLSSSQYATGSATTGKSYWSQVIVEPNADVAAAVVAKMSTPDWAQRCDKATRISGEQQNLDQTNAETDCGLTLVDPQENAFTSPDLPPGTVDWRFTGTVHCNLHDTDWSTGNDTLITRVGSVVIILSITFDGTLPDSTDLGIIGKLADRARAASAT
jgi:hypothetical protein